MLKIKNRNSRKRKQTEQKHLAGQTNLHLHSLTRIAQLLQSLFSEKYYVQEVLCDNSKHRGFSLVALLLAFRYTSLLLEH